MAGLENAQSLVLLHGGKEHRGGHGGHLLPDGVQIELQQGVALLHLVALLDQSPEALALEFHGVDAHMDEHFNAILQLQTNGVAGFEDKAHFGVTGRGNHTLTGHDSGAVTHHLFGKGLIRAAAHNENDQRLRQAAIDSQTGILTPTDEFRQMIIPHLTDPKLAGKPLILGSVGRWIGEEEPVMAALAQGNHPLRAVIVLHIPEAEVWRRWEIVKHTRNGGRADDQDRSRVKLRLDEFTTKTMPVINKYAQLGYTINIDATGSIDDTYNTVIDQLYRRATVAN